MDKSWIQYNRLSTEYEEGVQKFINFAIKNAGGSSVIRCPCVDCGNLSFETLTTVKDHLYMHGFDVKYGNWFWHGEEIHKSSSTQRENHFQQQNIEFDNGNELKMVNDAYKGCCGDPKAFKELLEQAEKPLYLGCTKFAKLSFLVKLFNVKGRFGWSDSSVSALLSVLADAFPKTNEIPTSMYEAKKTMSALGLEYVKIHACPNDCILYRKEYEGLLECPTCGLCRWKKKDGIVDQYRKGVPAKTLWYFPPIPRFKRMFQSSETTRDLTWHANERMVDETPKCRLKHSGKNVYIGHRLWLPHGHKFRFQAKAFDNSVCDETPPKLLNGEEIFQLVESIDNRWGKSNSKKRKSANNDDPVWWKKKSIFYNLEYWKHLLVWHQLDVMHIEKNVCENIYGTLLYIPGKSKDGLKSRMDLLEMKIRPTLAPQVKGNNNRAWLPPTCHTLTKEDKVRFCAALKSIKVPTGYSSNIRNLVSKKDFKL
ncbi:uncharacterized protein LOC127900769 [Citrus sinensis]|uniref:uncharacterized protein LOC127900769 n=1 Tax=Citrus sinensis TaxID=2711 RepID=UPI0022774315|nr:uncharacterized protein LOC127900769 [Citrus sinensis]